jgi:hypothetical protein
MTTTVTAFWIDADDDRERASDGKSRYGAYVRQNIKGFAECWDGTWDTALHVRFAAEAWRVATGPIMAPGYVRRHPRILGARLEYSYWDGSLSANVELITPWPGPLRQSSQWIKQIGHGWWHDWPMDFGDTYYDPGDEDISKRPYLLASAALRFTVPDSQLPQPPSAEPADAELVDLAQQSVAVLVAELNRIVGPVIQTLDTGGASQLEPGSGKVVQ